MLELFFFIIPGLVNSVFLIFIFLIRKNRNDHRATNRGGVFALGDSSSVYDLLVDTVTRKRRRKSLTGFLMRMLAKTQILMLPKDDEDSSKKGDLSGEPHRNRTCNLLIKSQLLCQLS